MRLKYNHYTAVGGREINEDSLFAEEKNNAYLFAVADGLGGEGNGDIASQAVVGELQAKFAQNNFSLCDAILQANLSILDIQKATKRKMKSTCAAVLIENDKTTVANVGDSRVYLFRGGEIVFQTRDHSKAQVAAVMGEITPEQIRDYKERNILTRALGVDEDVKVDINEFLNNEYDNILICSDGLWEYVLESEMTTALNSFGSLKRRLHKIRQLHDKKAPAKCDNNTAIVIAKR